MHELLEDLFDARKASKTRQFSQGVLLPFRSARFLSQNKKLVPFVIVPALINLVLFSISAYLMVTHAGSLLDWLWTKPVVDGIVGYLLVALWYVAYVITLALAIVVAYVVVLVVGGVLASPFHDFLSEHTERILRGVDELADSDESMVAGLIRSAISSGFIGLTYATIMAPIILLNLIPIAGSIASTILGTCVSAFFLALEYTDPTLERHHVRLKDKFGLIWQNLSLTGSFGLGCALLLWVPLLNFLCMPIAVIGGTAMGIVLEDVQNS